MWRPARWGVHNLGLAHMWETCRFDGLCGNKVWNIIQVPVMPEFFHSWDCISVKRKLVKERKEWSGWREQPTLCVDSEYDIRLYSPHRVLHLPLYKSPDIQSPGVFKQINELLLCNMYVIYLFPFLLFTNSLSDRDKSRATSIFPDYHLVIWRFIRCLLFWLLLLELLLFLRMLATYPPSASIRGDPLGNSWLSYPRLSQKERPKARGRRCGNRVMLHTFIIVEVQNNLLVGPLCLSLS